MPDIDSCLQPCRLDPCVILQADRGRCLKRLYWEGAAYNASVRTQSKNPIGGIMTAREALEMVMDALYDDRTAIEKGLVAARVMNLDDAKKMTDVMNELPNLDGHQTPEE